MISYREFQGGLPLYDSVFTMYGPFPYLANAVYYEVTGLTLDHDANRFKAMGLRLLAAALLGSPTRESRSLGLGSTAFFFSLVVLRDISGEAGHPQELIVNLIAGRVDVACGDGRVRDRAGGGRGGGLDDENQRRGVPGTGGGVRVRRVTGGSGPHWALHPATPVRVDEGHLGEDAGDPADGRRAGSPAAGRRPGAVPRFRPAFRPGLLLGTARIAGLLPGDCRGDRREGDVARSPGLRACSSSRSRSRRCFTCTLPLWNITITSCRRGPPPSVSGSPAGPTGSNSQGVRMAVDLARVALFRYRDLALARQAVGPGVREESHLLARLPLTWLVLIRDGGPETRTTGG